MKYLKLIVFIVFAIAFTSCNSDDEETTQEDVQSLIGSWSLTRLQGDIEGTFEIQGIAAPGNVGITGENFDYTITFTENTYEANGSYDVVVVGSLGGIPVSEERETITTDNASGSYTFEDDILEIDLEALGLNLMDFSLDVEDLDNRLDVVLDGDGNLTISQNIEITREENDVEEMISGSVIFTLSRI